MRHDKDRWSGLIGQRIGEDKRNQFPGFGVQVRELGERLVAA